VVRAGRRTDKIRDDGMDFATEEFRKEALVAAGLGPTLETGVQRFATQDALERTRKSRFIAGENE
jgi:hypothetical protein